MKTNGTHTILLTGASGFIGSHVAQYFSVSGLKLICSVRASSDTGFLQSLPLELITLDLEDGDRLIQSMPDVDYVIHTAGLVNDWSSYEEFYQANVICTRNILQACAVKGIKHVIVTGTNASYGEENNPGIKDEKSPAKPEYPYFLNRVVPNRLNHYRLTKYLATLEAMKIAKENGINLTVLEPVWVYGEREFSSGFYEYMKTVNSGIPFFPGKKTNNFHVIYAGDLARAYFMAYKSNLKGVNRILIGNSVVDKMHRILKIFCSEMGKKKPLNIPKWLISPFGLIMEFWAEIRRKESPPLLSRSRVNLYYDNINYSVEKARLLLFFEASTSIEKGIAKTVKWYRNHNLI